MFPLRRLPDGYRIAKKPVRDANLGEPEKIGWFQRPEFSVKEIFTDNHNWDRYYYVHRQEVRPVE
jgi:hypothetical protein